MVTPRRGRRSARATAASSRSPTSPGTPAGCTAFDLAAYAPGQSFTDPTTGARIDVRSGGGSGDVVRLTKS
ncbi:hypothetical protein BKA18_000463 [Streptomyces auratus]